MVKFKAGSYREIGISLCGLNVYSSKFYPTATPTMYSKIRGLRIIKVT